MIKSKHFLFWSMYVCACMCVREWPRKCTQIANFMGPTWGPPGSCRPQMGSMCAPWTLLSGAWCFAEGQTCYTHSELFCMQWNYFSSCPIVEVTPFLCNCTKNQGYQMEVEYNNVSERFLFITDFPVQAKFCRKLMIYRYEWEGGFMASVWKIKCPKKLHKHLLKYECGTVKFWITTKWEMFIYSVMHQLVSCSFSTNVIYVFARNDMFHVLLSYSIKKQPFMQFHN